MSLVDDAARVRENAHAPYSRFKVGAALRAESGAVHLGVNVENAVYATCVHPQIIGHAHHMLWYERLIQHLAEKDGVWFATMDEIARTWVPDDEDRRKMALPDVRGVEPPPADSSFARQ